MLPLLPADLPAAVLVVLHLAPELPSMLARVLGRDCALPVVPAADGLPIEAGRVYVGVPNRHLVVDQGDLIALRNGPRENRVRPAVDALFRSAARWAGPRVIGVVLSGGLDDGAAGLAAIAEQGGVALVQDPQDARFAGMPSAALAAVPAAEAAPATGLAKLVASHAGRPVAPWDAPDDSLIWETDMMKDGRSAIAQPGTPVGLGCPECGGGMREVRNGQAIHYVCHVGHSWSPQSFLAASDEGIEEALWTAISAMQEKAAVLGELATRADEAGDAETGRAHREQAERVARSAEVIRGHIDGKSQAAGTSS
ncbi:chemotaxis protein-glutamate methylesterase [Paractinoplanes deccanensis]|uniref:protein-glutamate methylesterase n=2 Tax=Paractinoplanes deccanensis TaxID=113561 RepID=A0ABQ3Y332_9ACTN|nr:chemotaxis protein-glutamate methylesterase [Actinoplanes deccanensis]